MHEAYRINPFICRMCGKKLEEWQKLDTLFCSPKCKTKSFDITHSRISKETALKFILTQRRIRYEELKAEFGGEAHV